MTNYEQAIAREGENRLLAYIGIGRPLFGRLMAAITWRHVLELSLAHNAFLAGTEPTRDDVFHFLWRLDVHFYRPDGSLPNWPRGAQPPGRVALLLAKFACYSISRQAAPNAIERPIREWLSEHWQDMPAGEPETESKHSSLSASLSWLDSIVDYLGRNDPQRIIDLSVAFTFQMLRAELIRTGEAARCIPPSAALKHFDN